MLKKLSVAVAAALLASCAVPPQQNKAAVPADSHYPVESVQDKAATAQQVANALLKDVPLSTDAKLAAYDNLWQRVADQMTLPIPAHEDIDAQKRFFIRNQKLLKTASENAQPFLYHIVSELERRKMPLELALLPIVESTYNPRAGSVSGVLGIWQFSSGTGRNFGLKQNPWYDGRSDVIESSRAALDYLQYLYSNVDQDWLSAIAAFNAGEGRVFKAIERNRYRNKPIDFWSLNLPKQTTAYIPKLLALAALLKNTEKYAIPMPVMANQPQTKVIQINRGLDLNKAARLLNISVTELKRLNPGFKSTTVPSSSYQLVVPFNSAADIGQQLAALPKVKVTPSATASRYKVKPGDSLSKIAANYKTTVSALQKANKLTTNQLKIGQQLIIPGFASSDDIKTTKALTVKPEAVTSAPQTYKVKSGDSLWEIGKKLNASPEQLMKWNKLNPKTQLKPGQMLTYYKGSGKKSKASGKTMTYKVKAGDSLASIAQRFKVKVADIVRWNNIKTNNYLQPGQELTLYLAS